MNQIPQILNCCSIGEHGVYHGVMNCFLRMALAWLS